MQGQRELRAGALVVGGSGGIGSAIVRRLAARGWETWASGRSETALKELACLDAGCPVHAWPGDVSDLDVPALVDDVRSAECSLKAVVHCAGIIEPGPLTEVDQDAALRILRVNAVAPLVLTSLLIPYLGRPATVVFINSTQGVSAGKGVGAYAVSKYALRGAADGLRQDLVGAGVRVTNVFPGRTATPMQEALYAQRGDEYRADLLLQPETIADLVGWLVTLPPTAEVTDVTIRPSLKSY
jgi:NAD(P)-dependent dehydrogenase (short-subunit alcohol dehydrogenase family)